MARNRIARSRVLSLRSALMVGAVGLLTVGMAQIGGTQAVYTDTAFANSGSFAASQNFWPTPVVPYGFKESTTQADIAVTCSTPDNYVNIEWKPVPQATRYHVVLVRDTVAATTPLDQIASGDIAWNFSTQGSWNQTTTKITNVKLGLKYDVWARVYTVNGPNISTGWAGAKIVWVSATAANDYSKCGTGPASFIRVTNANPAFEDNYDGDPNARPAGQKFTLAGNLLGSEEATTEEPPSTTDESATPTTGAEDSSSSATPAPTRPSVTPSTTPPSTTPSTKPPGTTSSTKPPVTTPTTPSGTPQGTTTSTPPSTPTSTAPATPPPPKLTNTVNGGPTGVRAGTSTNGNKAILVDSEGQLLVDGTIEQGSALKWVGDELWIIGDSQVSSISVASDGEWTFYKNGGTPPESLSGG